MDKNLIVFLLMIVCGVQTGSLFAAQPLLPEYTDIKTVSKKVGLNLVDMEADILNHIYIIDTYLEQIRNLEQHGPIPEEQKVFFEKNISDVIKSASKNHLTISSQLNNSNDEVIRDMRDKITRYTQFIMSYMKRKNVILRSKYGSLIRTGRQIGLNI